ncbi:acyltransferase family-domain-containing protein [Entophlyctis helioformis]|nr:acyltransferase family-domain-containing protein [Entophlyctis helioformis]
MHRREVVSIDLDGTAAAAHHRVAAYQPLAAADDNGSAGTHMGQSAHRRFRGQAVSETTSASASVSVSPMSPSLTVSALSLSTMAEGDDHYDLSTLAARGSGGTGGGLYTAVPTADARDAQAKFEAVVDVVETGVHGTTAPAMAATATTTGAAKSKASSGKLAHFDGLRGVVALTVVFIHFLPRISKPLYNLMLMNQSWKASVPLFFILSGRVVSVSVLRTTSMKQLVSCILRRPIRLLLPIMTMMFLDFLFFRVKSINSILDVLYTPVMFLFDKGKFNLLTGVVWTLEIEYHGSNVVYFLTFILLQYPSSARSRYTLLLAAFLWYQLTHSWNTHFVTGLALADLAHHGFMARYTRWPYMWVVNGLLATAAVLVSFKTDWWNVADGLDAWLRSVQSKNGVQGIAKPYFWDENFPVYVYSAVFMLLLECSTTMQRFYTLPPFLFLGRISFALYLFHDYWIRLFDPKPLAAWVGGDETTQVVTCIIVWTVPLLLISYVLTFIVDEPSVRVGKWLERVLVTDPWDGTPATLFKTPIAAALPVQLRRVVADIKPPRWSVASVKQFVDQHFPTVTRNTLNASKPVIQHHTDNDIIRL